MSIGGTSDEGAALIDGRLEAEGVAEPPSPTDVGVLAAWSAIEDAARSTFAGLLTASFDMVTNLEIPNSENMIMRIRKNETKFFDVIT